MTTFTYIKKSLSYYRRTHLGVVLGAAISTAILIAALVIGDSVRYSLERLVIDRLGRTSWAMQTGDRLFPSTFAQRLQQASGYTTAPVLSTRGIAVKGNESRVNNMQVLGVDVRFDRIGECDLYAYLKEGEVVINERLAKKLNAAPGDDILLRIEKLDAMPKDAPLASVEELSVSRRVHIKAVATANEFGRFSLNADQVEPFTAFLSLSFLQSLIDVGDKANVALAAAPLDEKNVESNIKNMTAKIFNYADAGYWFKFLEHKSGVELRSDRIFIDPPMVQKIETLDPEAVPVVTYLVNELRSGKNSTPYSFVSTANAVDVDLQTGDGVINSWLAADLGAQVGDELSMSYFRLGPMRRLIEDTTTVRIRRIVPLAGRFADVDLMPDFPGLSDEENCRDWDAGIPIDLDKIRDKDEDYWDDFRGTPKAFISIEQARTLWGNVFGDVTAIRFPSGNLEKIEAKISEVLDPTDFGFVFFPVRDRGVDAAQNSVDFAGLFVGLSFFLIVAALLLTGLLFVFGVEFRSQETGLLLAVGFQSKTARKMLLLEGLVLAVIGAFLGVIIGLLFHQLILAALKTIWIDIVGTSALKLYVKPLTILLGVCIGVLTSLFSMWLSIRKSARRSIADLQKGALKIDPVDEGKTWGAPAIGLLCLLAVIVVVILTPPGRSQQASTTFFIAGALSLISGLAFTHFYLTRLSRPRRARPDLASFGRRNNGRRRSQSLTLVGILAAGVFLTFTVGANRTSTKINAANRSSGTGGFALWGESSLPLVYDANSKEGREYYGLEDEDVHFVQFKVKEGDEASCLNLYKIANPRVLGVEASAMDQREAFTFVAATEEVVGNRPWQALNIEYDNNVIPGIADQTVITWSFGLTVGDTLHYVDENGVEFHVRLVGALANSIFQGNLIISQENFVDRYPSIGGSRAMLVDAPFETLEQISKDLTWAFQDVGLDLTPTAQRLAEFGAVTNTYLSIFMILGALGLILGSIGIGVVLLRNVMVRRNEFGIMRALGFEISAIQRMVFLEHFVLVIIGFGIGAASSLISILPALLTPGAEIPIATVLVASALVILSGILWTKLASIFALRGDVFDALRNE